MWKLLSFCISFPSKLAEVEITWSLVVIGETFLGSTSGGTSACDLDNALTEFDVCRLLFLGTPRINLSTAVFSCVTDANFVLFDEIVLAGHIGEKIFVCKKSE